MFINFYRAFGFYFILILYILYFIEHWSEMREFVANFVHQPGVYHVKMDRKVYQEHSTTIKESGFFPITLYWHLDGAPAMKSKSMSLWPIQSFLVELPLNLRYSYKNILLSGLWNGKKKHDMQIFQDVPDLETSADSTHKTEPEPADKSSDEIERSLPAPTPFNANTSDLYT